uniref:Uncharacterized protein n=1 Tax=Mustela putorius furo TaxID=9669 RepID=M3Y778_MUSPF
MTRNRQIPEKPTAAPFGDSKPSRFLQHIPTPLLLKEEVGCLPESAACGIRARRAAAPLCLGSSFKVTSS